MRTNPRRKHGFNAVLIALITTVILSGATNAQTVQPVSGTLRGVVTTAGPDGQSYNVPAATLKLKQSVQIAETSANETGEYEFTKLAPGEYTLETTVDGFKPNIKTVTIRAGETSVEKIILEVADVTATVTIASTTDVLASTEAAATNTVKQNTLQTLPLPNEQLLDAVPLVPGVVRGPDGEIDMNGARASQSS